MIHAVGTAASIFSVRFQSWARLQAPPYDKNQSFPCLLPSCFGSLRHVTATALGQKTDNNCNLVEGEFSSILVSPHPHLIRARQHPLHYHQADLVGRLELEIDDELELLRLLNRQIEVSRLPIKFSE